MFESPTCTDGKSGLWWWYVSPSGLGSELWRDGLCKLSVVALVLRFFAAVELNGTAIFIEFGGDETNAGRLWTLELLARRYWSTADRGANLLEARCSDRPKFSTLLLNFMFFMTLFAPETSRC